MLPGCKSVWTKLSVSSILRYVSTPTAAICNPAYTIQLFVQRWTHAPPLSGSGMPACPHWRWLNSGVQIHLSTLGKAEESSSEPAMKILPFQIGYISMCQDCGEHCRTAQEYNTWVFKAERFLRNSYRGAPLSKLSTITPSETCMSPAHPCWDDENPDSQAVVKRN